MKGSRGFFTLQAAICFLLASMLLLGLVQLQYQCLKLWQRHRYLQYCISLVHQEKNAEIGHREEILVGKVMIKEVYILSEPQAANLIYVENTK